MAIVKYKVVQIFEFRGQKMGLGEELILPDGVGEELVEEGKVTLSRALDPKDPEDAKLIKDADDGIKKDHAADVKRDSDRDAQKDSDLRKEDEENEKKNKKGDVDDASSSAKRGGKK